jgi:hypothetical protein
VIFLQARMRGAATAWLGATMLAAFVSGVTAAGLAAATPPGVFVRPIGDQTVVFHSSVEGCDREDFPDAPARAVRLADGTVALFAANQKNRVLRGVDLLSVRSDCTVVFTGRWETDPSQYDDRLWLASPWTDDGVNIAALVHSEYQGNRHPGQCPSGRYIDCWYNAITLATSRDGAHSFSRAAGATALVASIPYPYDPDASGHVGYFNPSNLAMRDGNVYAMMWATQYREQHLGNCLIRADRPGVPTSWRAWDGAAFAVQFIDPYQSTALAAAHVCPVVDRDHLRGPVVSLVRHGPSGVYVALFVAANPVLGAALPWAVFASASRDLIHWAAPRVVMPVARFDADACPPAPPLAYPSLLDPDSASANFDTIGDTAQLFLTRFNLTGCRTSSDRDLIRIPVSITVDPW